MINESDINYSWFSFSGPTGNPIVLAVHMPTGITAEARGTVAEAKAECRRQIIEALQNNTCKE